MGLNDLVSKAKNSPYKYSAAKKNETSISALCCSKLPEFERVDINVIAYEPNDRRDPDNVQVCFKPILDGLVKAGKLPNDTSKHVGKLSFEKRIDKNYPRIEVELIPL